MSKVEMIQEIQELRGIIGPATKRINELYAELRMVCNHEHIKEGNYRFERPPNILPAKFCTDCYHVIEYLPLPPTNMTKWEYSTNE